MCPFTTDLARPRVLIAEDDALVAVVIEDAVRAAGGTVVGKAPDGRRAVELTETLRPDVVLMDVRMPEMGGIEAAELIARRCPTPLVMLTVHTEPEVVAEAARAGVGAYLVKPSTPEEMSRAILVARARFADLMELRQLNAELRRALESVKTLSGFLPICTHCKRIRNAEGAWVAVEVYVRDHTHAEFTHGLCPRCLEEQYPRAIYPWIHEEGSGPPPPPQKP
jgi:AmiR/NasT family two-component response regulator